MFYPLTVRDFLDRAVHVYPDRVAIVDEPDQPAPSLGELTYSDVGRLAAAQAAKLDQLGVGPGERVAVVSQNSARLYTSFFGVSGYGRVLVPINFRLSRSEIAYIVEHSGASVVYVDPEQKAIFDSLDVPKKFLLGDDDDLYLHDTEPQEWDDRDENATATINYTSGTTARPKGVQLTHRNNWLNATVFGLHTTIGDRDVYLHTLPMFHANGWGMPFAMTGVGARHVVLRKVDGTEILRRVERHGVTAMCAAPAVISAALDGAQSWDGEIPGRDRVRIIAAGAPPPTRTIERVMDELGWEFIQIYGLTETSPLVTVNRSRAEWDDLDTHDRARHLGRAGAPALGVRVEIDTDGEVLTASNHNLAGYWNQPDATQEAQAGNWFHTGDGGYLDDDGYLVISDRKKDVIISGGENVSSIEVEDALMSHPAVKEVAVIGIPDEKWGELVTALVVVDKQNTADGSISPEELIAHCRENLAGYKCPKRVDFVDDLPRTATGKLQKFKLRETFWEGRDRQVN
ncbi:AMP-binding protein [Jatrophihabitans endophyticus]|uniref:AMP-binding protein n=1 Tax=Jatrophihabitans endophyticus TaxID=1206085 RepID=UPI001A0615FB|nr:AMP-binding protein [Jatrophihabitans endophyticus]MBE7187244.1 AMP-binding protein [Jatrophihabitans endophyticus]